MTGHLRAAANLVGAILLGTLSILLWIAAAIEGIAVFITDTIEPTGPGSTVPVFGVLAALFAIMCWRGFRACWNTYWHADREL